ncbi:hypothetical protein [Actinophytocola sp.]|uniref:hypothetical protein n=1 Tax=Actinophytocola sp. TaxID=1872138 RepID=UPI003D6B6748
MSTPDKVGRDAGELAGVGPLGVAATNDADALLALHPDCVVYTAMADDRITEALDDLARILRAGVNVVSSSPVFLRYPTGVVPEGVIEPIRRAATEGGASLWVNGIDPGFANDWLPLVLADLGVPAHRRGPLPGDPRLLHLRQRQGAVRHHGVRPARRRQPDAAHAGRAVAGVGQHGAPAPRPGWVSSWTVSRSRRPGYPREIAAGMVAAGTAAAPRFERCAGCAAAGRCACSST